MITSVRLKNFKNFADETLHLGPFTVIVGANASGKSNIRDAFRFLHGIGRGYSLADIVGGRRGAGEWEPIRGAVNEIMRFGESEFTLEAMIDLSSRESDMKEFLRILGDSNDSASTELNYVIPSSGEIDMKEFLRILEDSNDPVPTELKYVIQVDCDAAPEGGFSIKEASLRADKGYTWERPGDWLRPDGASLADRSPLPDYFPERDLKLPILREEIEKAFGGIRFLDPNPNLMRQPSFPGQTVLGDGGENLPTVLQEICADEKRKFTLTEWIQELTPMDVADFRFPSDPSGRIHLTMQERNDREISAYSASDGTLRFLAILAALLGPDPAGLYFIEEIENGIHPSRIHLLLDLIERQTGKGKIQVVATTHSPALFNVMSDPTFENASVVCRLPDSADAVIRRVSALPNARDLRKTQGLGRLLEGGWMETVLAFTEGGAEDSG